MNQSQALTQAKRLLGRKLVVLKHRAGVKYPNGNPRPSHSIGIVVMGMFNEIQADGFSWQEAIDNLKEKQHA